MSASAHAPPLQEPKGDGGFPASETFPVDVKRWEEQRAEIPALRAQLRAAEQQRDVDKERALSAALARALVSRRRELDTAVRLARRAVLLGDEGLRLELANWHCQLGQVSLAVGILSPLVEAPGLDRAHLLMRVALYWARLGKAGEAVSALREAAAYSPDEPLVLELQGTAHGWASGQITAQAASDAYLSASALRRQRGEDKEAFENALRAFDTAPVSSAAAEALDAQLRGQGRPDAAREVWRRHGVALSLAGEAQRAQDARRVLLERCLAEGAPEEAFALALVGGRDADLEPDAVLAVAQQVVRGQLPELPASGAQTFDWLCMRTGLEELHCARLELVAESLQGRARAECYDALGQLLLSLGHLDRALSCFSDSLVADPERVSVVESLQRHAHKTGDHGPLLEALLRAVQQSERIGIEGCLQSLRRLAAGRLADPTLELYCVDRLFQLAPSAELEQERERLLPLADEATEQLEQTLLLLDAKQGEDRAPLLKRAALLLRLRPERGGQYAQTLEELLEYNADELIWRRMYERLLLRMSDRSGLARLWTRDLLALHEPNRALWAVLGLSKLERLGGNLQGALAVLAADDDRGLTPAAAYEWTLAARLGQHRLRNEAIIKCVAGRSPRMVAWAASAASTGLHAAGEEAAALRAAEVGTRADPSCAAPLVAFADASAGVAERVAAVAHERAMALTFPSTRHCKGLVQCLEALADLESAQLWTSRWLGLRPADTEATRCLLRLAAASRNPARIGDAIAWTISQAHPVGRWAAPLGHALEVLVDLDPERASGLAWSLIDAVGPTPADVRNAVVKVAERAPDWKLKEAVLERVLGAGELQDRGECVWQLIELHRSQGDAERCMPCLVRALDVGVQPARVVEVALSLEAPSSPEGVFYRLQALAESYVALGRCDDQAWLTLRQYGMALWDLARDRKEALRVWYRVAGMFGARSWLRMLLDLESVVGVQEALRAARRMAESEEEGNRAAQLLGASARLAQMRGRSEQATELALLALDTDPSSVSALSVVEECCTEDDASAVQHAYETALRATLGSFGERSLHYRAARFFERRGMKRRALEHAVGAFDAVPSEGVVFALLLRLASTHSAAAKACQAVVDVARRSSHGSFRSEWLRRAALVAARCKDGQQRRTELLLEALVADPEPATVELWERSLTDLAHGQPGGKQIGRMRFERALRELLPRLSGDSGAAVALALGQVALQSFGAPGLAWEALKCAVALDAQHPGFGQLSEDAELLRQDAEGLAEWELAFDEITQQGKRAGEELLDFALSLSALASDGEEGTSFRHMCLLVRRFQRETDNEAVRVAAERAVLDCRQTLPRFVQDAFPALASVVEAQVRADAAAAAGDAEGELACLTEVLAQQERPSRALSVRVLELAVALERHDVAESTLLVAIEAGLSKEELMANLKPLVLQLVEQGAAERAVSLLSELERKLPASVDLAKLGLMAAQAAGEEQRSQGMLQKLVELTSGTPKQREWFSKAWELAHQRSDDDLSYQLLQSWLQAHPEDPEALDRLEARHRSRQEWEALAEVLAAHLSLSLSFRERRRLTLERSNVLVVHLGRLQEARLELQALAEHAPADAAVVERLAEIAEYMGAKSEAAELWLTASGLAATGSVAMQLAEKACRLYLDDGQLLSARRVLAAPQTLPRSLPLAKLAVRLEREGENQPRLARALEELSAVPEQSNAERGAALMEAAGLWRRLGDDERAYQCAAQGAQWLPEDADAQLMASYLAYARSGSMPSEDAAATVERLRWVLPRLASEQGDLAAFLLAEALDVPGGPGTGLQELEELMGKLGKGPLVSLALAERLARDASDQTALEHFDAALRGDLRSVRHPASVALSAARVARDMGLLGRAHRYVRRAESESDPEFEEEAAQLRAELEGPLSSAPPPRVRDSKPTRHASVHDQPTRPARRTRMGLGLSAPEIKEDARFREPNVQAPEPYGSPPSVDASLSDEAPPRQKELLQQLHSGQADAAIELIALLDVHGASDDELLAVLMAWWRVRPATQVVWRRLCRWAQRRGDTVYWEALQQLGRCMREDAPRGRVPPLNAQICQPQRVRELLFGGFDPDLQATLSKAYHVLAEHLEWPLPLAIDRARRVRPDENTPVSRSYFPIARLLGLEAQPLLQLDSAQPVAVFPFHLPGPGVCVRSHSTPKSSELSFQLGAALALTLPGFCLVGLLESDQRAQVFDALRAIAQDREPTDQHSARLFRPLARQLSPSDRRALHACMDRGVLSEERGLAVAAWAARRAGLFACADLSHALAEACRVYGLDPSTLERKDGLATLCSQSVGIRDLVVLAADPAYARFRWRSDSIRPTQGGTRLGM